MKIDAHQHFWKYDPVKGAWISDDMKIIRQDFLPIDLKSILDEHAIDGCVAVQADQSVAENDFLLGLAEQYPFIKGVVGWVDLKATDLGNQLDQYSEYDKLKGIRHVIQIEPDGFMMDPKFIEGVSQLNQYGLTYDILTVERQLEEAVKFVDSLPEMKLVIDHISKPNIAESSFDHWAKYMKEMSKRQNVYVKLSGMITEANWDSWDAGTLEPYVDFCLEQFGADRLMYGSDWPVCLVAGEYKEMRSALETCLTKLSTSEQNQIFGLTATDFYNLA